MPTLRSEPYEDRRLRKLAAHARSGSVLDLGYAQHPNPHLRGVRRVGLDLSPNRGAVRYEEELVGDVADSAGILGGRTFQTVLCGEFIEHLERPYDFLRALRAHLAPGGRLVLSTPNPLGFPVVLAELLRSRRFFYTPDHVYYFTPRWVERLLVRAGYRVVQTQGVGLWLPGAWLPSPAVSLSYQVIYVAEVAPPSGADGG